MGRLIVVAVRELNATRSTTESNGVLPLSRQRLSLLKSIERTAARLDIRRAAGKCLAFCGALRESSGKNLEALPLAWSTVAETGGTRLAAAAGETRPK
jgi:hypothetical protein